MIHFLLLLTFLILNTPLPAPNPSSGRATPAVTLSMKINGRNQNGLVQLLKNAKEPGNAPCVLRLLPNQLLGIFIHVIPEVQLQRV
jgi:hypothetical protein